MKQAMNLGAFVRARRQQLKMGQVDFAQACGVQGLQITESWVSRLENGKIGNQIGGDKIEQLAATLDVHPWLVWFYAGRIPPALIVPAHQTNVLIGMSLLGVAVGRLEDSPPIAYDAAKKIHLLKPSLTKDEELAEKRALLKAGAEPMDPEQARICEEMRDSIPTDAPRDVDPVPEPAGDVW